MNAPIAPIAPIAQPPSNLEEQIVPFLLGLKRELDACRQRVDALSTELSTQRSNFETYRTETDAKLTKLRRQKKILTREVVALRIEFNDDGGGREITREKQQQATTAPPRQQRQPENKSKSLPDNNDEDSDELMSLFEILDEGVKEDMEKEDSDVARMTVGFKTGEPLEGIGLKYDPAAAHDDDATIDGSNRSSSAKENAAIAEASNRMGGGNTAMMGMMRSDRRSSAISQTSISSDPAAGSKDRVFRRRMSLLRHASRCNAPEGTCRVSRHCAATKAVLRHIAAGCDDPNCKVEHCVSSRYVLSKSHYGRSTPLLRGAICSAVEGSSSSGNGKMPASAARCDSDGVHDSDSDGN